MLKNKKGFTLVEVVLVIVALAAIGFAGWTWYQANQAEEVTENKERTGEIEKEEESSIPEGWTEYRNEELGFAFAYPEEWGEVQLQENTGQTGNQYLALFSDNSSVSFSGATLDYRAQRGGGVLTGKNKGWEEENSTYYYIENYSDDNYRSEAGDVSELETENTTGLYQQNLDPSIMFEASEIHTVSFNVTESSYNGLAFAYQAPEGQEEQKTSLRVEEFKDVVETVEVLQE